MTTLQIIFRGRVQGVGFRETLRRYALNLGVKGFARNLADGSVELIAQSDEAVLQKLLEAVKARPRGAKIKECHVTPKMDDETYQNFSIQRAP